MRRSSFIIIVRRIFRSLKIRTGRLVIRFKYVSGIRRQSNLKFKIYPWSDLAAIPGNPAYFPCTESCNYAKETRKLADELIDHHFRIFTDQVLDISILSKERKSSIVKICHEIDQKILDSYKTIDWHRDFYSGFRWSPHLFFHDIKVAPIPGVDIKVPRELSRFQHVGALAYGDQEKTSLEFMLQVTDWIIANPFNRGVNWECSMDVAIRAINWIWGLRFFEPGLSGYSCFQQLIANSLRDHGQHIYENLDYYGKDVPTGNHYLADIAGLIYIGAALPELPEADLWLAFGIQELVSESQREVLDDGMCYEASTSYHRLVTELFVSCSALIERIPFNRRQRLIDLDINLHKVQPPLKSLLGQVNLSAESQLLPSSFYARLKLMAEFSLAMRKPNGFVCQIGDNDSARVHKLMPEPNSDIRNHDHIFSTVGELLGDEALKKAGKLCLQEGLLICGGLHVEAELYERKGIFSGIELFSQAGIASQKSGTAWLGVSCGQSGQGGRGGHGHNDKNSFELNVNTIDFVVDGGCPAYTYDPITRNRFRSTEMHSTIYVANLEQNRWPVGARGLFMLPENAAPNLVVEDNQIIKGTHYGYGNCHTRRFHLSEKRLLIDDQFIDDRERYLIFNLHPEVIVTDSVTEIDGISVQLQQGGKFMIYLDVKGVSELEVFPGAFSIGYMRPVENQRLCFRINAHQIKSVFSW